MTPETVMTIAQRALEMTLMLAAPLLLVALLVGLLVGIFQAATQINEMTLSFIPKLIGMATAMVIAGPWMLKQLVELHAHADREHSVADRLEPATASHAGLHLFPDRELDRRAPSGRSCASAPA